jgi:hypothetical protein
MKQKTRKFCLMTLSIAKIRKSSFGGERKYKYGALVECYLRDKIEVLREKPVPVPLCQPQISH